MFYLKKVEIHMHTCAYINTPKKIALKVNANARGFELNPTLQLTVPNKEVV
ncbi:22887_t:CDS:2 [Cetraspora pellucida]|uniref:22887_t:CDS:1 n=1 Tax=Cetraspora pellucida TaxID=1433469 RepID=A0A9N9EFQ2_9GLOM|nr:22887_t:CDS:2 [Cetraspora pellucida]